MTATIAIMVFLVLLSGGLVAATPLLMPSTECFAVSIPPIAQKDPRIRSLKKAFVVFAASVTLVCGLGTGAFIAIHGIQPSDSTLFAAVITLATLLPIVASFALMLVFRSRVQRLKKAEGWEASSSKAAAVIVDGQVPQPLPLAWNLLYVVIVAALVAFSLANYDSYPDRIPMQVGFDGSVTTWAYKSYGVVLFPALFSAFMGITFTLAHWSILRSKKPVDPEAPATSAFAYGTFARAQSIALLAGGLLITLATAVFINLASLGIIALSCAAVAITAVALAFAGVEIWIAVAMGQSGARIADELHTSNELARDDDAYWKLGMFYINPGDPSIIVPKRFGVGWTFNLARPAAWGIFALVIAGTIGFAWASSVVVG